MKRAPLIIALGIAILMFLFSCAGMKEQPAGETAPEVSKETVTEVPEDALLAVKHEATGISCSDCHAEDPPAERVPTDACMTCHEDYKDLAASYLDPHNAHVTYSNCSDCHHVHRESELICQGCHHTFNVQAP